MMLLSAIQRCIVYGAFFGITYAFFWWMDFSIDGSTGFRVFISLTVVNGILQAANFAVIAKLSDLGGGDKAGYWEMRRLTSRLEARVKAAWWRSMLGWGFAFLAAGLSGWMFALGSELVPPFILGPATAAVLLSYIFVFLTIHEYILLTQLDAFLSREAQRKKGKHEALKEFSEKQDGS